VLQLPATPLGGLHKKSGPRRWDAISSAGGNSKAQRLHDATLRQGAKYIVTPQMRDKDESELKLGTQPQERRHG